MPTPTPAPEPFTACTSVLSRYNEAGYLGTTIPIHKGELIGHVDVDSVHRAWLYLGIKPEDSSIDPTSYISDSLPLTPKSQPNLTNIRSLVTGALFVTDPYTPVYSVNDGYIVFKGMSFTDYMGMVIVVGNDCTIVEYQRLADFGKDFERTLPLCAVPQGETTSLSMLPDRLGLKHIRVAQISWAGDGTFTQNEDGSFSWSVATTGIYHVVGNATNESGSCSYYLTIDVKK